MTLLIHILALIGALFLVACVGLLIERFTGGPDEIA